MENVYSQTDDERFSIVPIPDGMPEDSGNTLYSWLGSLWRGLNKGDGMVRGLQAARGIRLAQLYLDILEAAGLKDRNGMPVFHRELWHPIIIRRSEMDSAQENMLRLGGTDRKIGPQPYGSEYGYGTVFEIGKMANYEHFVTYPVDPCIVGGAKTIVDNIVKPTIVMERGDGKDFEIRNDSIIFHKDNDPISEQSPSEKYDVHAKDGEDPGDLDVEAVLWASDVLFDRKYISNHLGYVLGANAPSSDVVKRILNTAWSSVASGLTPELIRTLIAAMLNIPVIQNEAETVIDIFKDEDAGATIVVTDRCRYKVSGKARLRPGMHSGTILRRGDLIDESLRIYPCLDVETDTGFSVPLEQDIPSIVLPSAMIRARTEFGLYAMWGDSVVKRSVRSPGTDDLPHLYFDIGGADSDVRSFWDDVWYNADSSGTNMRSIVGEEGKHVSPARFVLKNLVGANSIFVVVDKSQIDDISMMRDPMFFDMLSNVIPSAVRLFVVEHVSICEDMADLDESYELERMYAALPCVSDVVSEIGEESLTSSDPSVGEMVSLRFIRPAPAKIKWGKEEEL